MIQEKKYLCRSCFLIQRSFLVIFRSMANSKFNDTLSKRDDESWGSGDEPRLLQRKTAIIQVGSNPDFRDVLNTLKASGFSESDISGVQFRTRDLIAITFINSDLKDRFVAKNTLNVKGSVSFIQDEQQKVSFLNIYGASAELPDGAILVSLSRFGTIIGMRRGKYANTNIENGIRHVRMKLDKDIPSYIRLASEVIRVTYLGQPPTCRKCDSPDHMAAACRDQKCFNCGSVEHLARNCPEEKRCAFCHSLEHKFKECDFAYMSLEKIDKTSTPANNNNNSKPAEESDESESEDDSYQSSEDVGTENRMETTAIEAKSPKRTAPTSSSENEKQPEHTDKQTPKPKRKKKNRSKTRA